MNGKIKQYRDSEGQAESQDSLLRYMGLVKKIAIFLRARLPEYMELNDMVQLGMLGLMEAYKNFDESQGGDFEAFAKIRIRGAIIDEARKLSKITRKAIETKKSHEEAKLLLQNTLERNPTNREVADHLNLSIEEFEHQRTHANSFNFQELEPMLENEEFDIADQDGDVLETMVSNENRQLIQQSISELDDRKRLILSLYYIDEMNLKEIGAIIGVNESRISQILKETVTDIRYKIARKSQADI
jgi:RNA polymerase sigma factor for flagellar operon FliA